MSRLMKEEYRVCATCSSAPMRKLPYLDGVYMCEVCFGFAYRLPEEWELPQEEDDALYREETSEE